MEFEEIVRFYKIIVRMLKANQITKKDKKTDVNIFVNHLPVNTLPNVHLLYSKGENSVTFYFLSKDYKDFILLGKNGRIRVENKKIISLSSDSFDDIFLENTVDDLPEIDKYSEEDLFFLKLKYYDLFPLI